MSGSVNYVELLGKAQLGDGESMSRLTRLVEERLFAYILRLTLNNDLAQDLSQDTLLTMVKSLKRLKFEHEEQFLSWLFQTAWGKVHSHFRNQQQEKSRQMSAVDREQFLSKCTSGDHCDGLQALMRKELSATIFEAMAKLRDRQRNVLVLRCFEQMPYSEIASIMNCSELTAQVLFFRAKRSLKRQLSRQGFDKGSLLIALGLFARLTRPAKASFATTSVTATSTKVGLTATVIGAVGTKLGILVATGITAAALTIGGITMTAMNNDNVPKGPEVTFLNPIPDGDDWFGRPIAMVGDNILIGACGDDVGANDAGAAYLFDSNGTLLQTFHSATPAAGDYFGMAIATLGSKILIGAPGEDVGATDAGAAYLFDASGTLLQTFQDPAAADYDWFGSAVALVGSNILVSAPGDDSAGTDAGAVYLFNARGALLQTFLGPASEAEVWFGSAVAVVGNNILVGAPGDDTGGTDAGAVYLYDRSGTLLQSFLNPTPAIDDRFGYCTATLGNNVLVGAPRDDSGATNAGAVYLFDPNGSLLQTFLNPTPEAEDSFGSRGIVPVGSNILIGVPRDDTGGRDSGIAYLFAPDGTLLQNFLNPTPEPNDRFGAAVAGMGNNVLISAPGDHSGKNRGGAVYLYEVPVFNKNRTSSAFN
jgi:RNA polymerase sigma factor (sigma-70 family)